MKYLKRLLFIICLLIDSPLILLTWLEAGIFGVNQEHIFSSCKDFLSLCPTLIGLYMRKAYYWAVCTDVSPDVHFLFGSWLAHRQNIIRRGVIIGNHTYIGYAYIEENVLMAARVSIVSGKYQHGHPEQRNQGKEIIEENLVIHIGKNSWIGQDSVILADIGQNCTVGAGSVVFKAVPDGTTVLGNPARKVNLDNPQSSDDSPKV